MLRQCVLAFLIGLLLMLALIGSSRACDFRRVPTTCEDVQCWVDRLGLRWAERLARRLGAKDWQIEQARQCAQSR